MFHFKGKMKEATIRQLPRPELGEMYFAEDTEHIMVYDGSNWMYYENPVEEVVNDEEKSASEISMDLYELNRSLISSLGHIDPDVIPEKMAMIREFREDTRNMYYMLYGKEIGYFTVFTMAEALYELETLDLGVMECLANVGPIYSIEKVPDGSAIEIWVQAEDILTCMYLFPYDNGIVRIGV